MKHYLLFGGTSRTVRGGGWYDLLGSFDEYWEVRDVIENRDTPLEWWHVVNSKTGKTLDSYGDPTPLP